MPPGGQRAARFTLLTLGFTTLVLGCDQPPRAPRDSAVPPDTVVRRVVRVQRRASAMQRVTGFVYARNALEPLDSLLVIRVLDRRGVGLPGARVRWSLVQGGDGARLRILNEVTDSHGLSRAAFTPGRTANAQGAAALVDDVGRIEFSFIVPVAHVRLEPEDATLWSSDVRVVGATLFDTAGAMLDGGSMSWAVSDSSVLRLAPADSTHARVTGGLAGAADLVGWMGLVQGQARFLVHPVTTGTFETLDGAPVPRISLDVRAGAWRDSIVVENATFTTRVPPLEVTDVHFRAVPIGGTGRHHRAHLRVLSPRDLHVVNIALIPTRWRIDAGTYQGREVAIDAAAAMRPVGGRAPFWRLAPVSGRGPKTLLGWRSSDMPIRVAFNRANSDAWITESDSIAFWATARRMEEDIGSRLFVPASMDAGAGSVVPVEIREQMAEAHTFVSWTQAGDVNDAVLLFRSPAAMRDPHVATHELLHLLGFGHVSSWASVAEPVGGREQRLTAEDVAHVQVATRLRARQARTGARPGLPQASQ